MIQAWLEDDGFRVKDLDTGEMMMFDTINEALGVIAERIEGDSIGEPVSVPVIIFEPTATRGSRVWAWHPNFTPENLRQSLPIEMGD